jgi:orotate phosphoribosyltransferase
MSHAYRLIDKEIGWNKIDAVAGGETAGIPFAAFLAALAKKSMVYVRKQPKGFGRMGQIEGDLKPGKRVLLVEDLATDGGSKLVFIDALKRAEAKVTDCFVIFHYGIFPQSIEMLAAAGVKLHALATWWDALEAAQKHKYFDERGLTETKAFLEAPEQWSATHGGRPPLRPMLGR